MGTTGFGASGIGCGMNPAFTQGYHMVGKLRNQFFAETNVGFENREIAVVYAYYFGVMRQSSLQLRLGVNFKQSIKAGGICR